MNDKVSKEFLHAFVDGELAADERERAMAMLERDADFKAQVCETRVLKELVNGAYAEVRPPAARRRTGWGMAHGGQDLAAGLLLVIGLGGGWLARGQLDQPAQMDRLAGLPVGYQPIALSHRVDENKVLLHLDSADASRMAAVLDLAEAFIARRGEAARVQVVVNSNGINLLRQDTSPLRARIDRLAALHRNLAFVACGQTLARLRREGVEVKLVPEASVSSTAIGEILGRMREGWVYVKV